MIGDATLPPLPHVRPAAAGHGPGAVPRADPPPAVRPDADAAAGGVISEALRPDRDTAVTAAARDDREGFGADGRQPSLVGVTLYQDAASRRCVAVIRDEATGEVIEQIPTDRLLEHYAALRERFAHVGVEIEV